MDIDEFLDRELSGLDFATDKPSINEPFSEFPQKKEDFEPSSSLESVKSLLAKGNIEEAEHSYVELWRTLLQQKLKWSRDIYEELLMLSRQFLVELNKAYADVKKKADYINDIIKKARASIQEGKKDLSYKMYAQAVEMNNSIPNVFFEEKKFVQEHITLLYNELRRATDNELINRVYALVHELNQLIDKTNLSIKSNDFSSAILSYNKLIDVYNQVPEGFLRDKASLGIRILEIYKSLSIQSEILSLQKQIIQQAVAQPETLSKESPSKYSPPASSSVSAKKESAKNNMEKGLYSEAYKDIQDVLKIEPNDSEAKVMHAKIKTLQ